MRKATILALLLPVLCLCGVILTAAAVHEAHDQVVLTETTIYGDPAAADGLTVRLRTDYKNHLFWDTVYPTGGTPETEFLFSSDAVYSHRDISFMGVDLGSYPEDVGIWQEEIPPIGIGVAYQELADQTAPGEEKTMSFYLKDYMDYYPITVTVDVPDFTQSLTPWDVYHSDMTGEYCFPDETSLRKIQEYFKIPVMEEERYEITIGKNVSGSIASTGGGSGMSDAYYLYTYSELTDDACYFTINTHSSESKQVDMSLLPDGYGIFRMPYEPGRTDADGDEICPLDPDRLEMVYPLDPAIDVCYLHTNHAQTRLLLHAIEDGKYVLTIIDIETMETLQRLEITDWPEEHSGSQLFVEDDFVMLLLWATEQIAVLAETDSGYSLEILCDIHPEELEYLGLSDAAVDFDGEKLAAAGMLYGGEYRNRDTCDFFLAVYDASGMRYYGEYANSLNTGADPDNYSYHIHGTDAEAVTVTWPEN